MRFDLLNPSHALREREDRWARFLYKVLPMIGALALAWLASGILHPTLVPMALALMLSGFLGGLLIMIAHDGKGGWRDVAVALLYLAILYALEYNHRGDSLPVLSALLFFPLAWISFFDRFFHLLLVYLATLFWIVCAISFMGAGWGEGLLFAVILFVGPFTLYALMQSLRLENRRAYAREQRLVRILDSAGAAFVSMEESGIIRGWNPKAEGLFGYKADEIHGQNLFETILPGLSFRDLKSGIELTGLSRSGDQIPVEVYLSITNWEGQKIYSLFLHDISERKKHERYRELSHDIARYLSNAPSLEEAMPRILQALSRELEWPNIVVWLEDLDNRHLYCAGAYPAQEQVWQEKWKEGEDLLGNMWRQSLPFWIPRLEPKNKRAKILLEEGKHCVLIVPMRQKNRTVGLMEFSSAVECIPENEITQNLSVIASQIAQFAARLDAEKQLRSSQAMEINDSIVQNLTIAKMHHEMGRPEKALPAINMAMESAKQIITSLVARRYRGKLILGPIDLANGKEQSAMENEEDEPPSTTELLASLQDSEIVGHEIDESPDPEDSSDDNTPGDLA